MRLNRQPCTTCHEDTIHKGPVCTVCGVVAPMPGMERRAKRRSRVARMIVGMGRVAASNYLQREREGIERMKARELYLTGQRGVDKPQYSRGGHRSNGLAMRRSGPTKK